MTDEQDDVNDPAYQAGHTDMLRMHAEAQRRGWRVPLRRIVREIFLLEHSAAGQRADTLPMLERRPMPPQWYRGRAAALREILRRERDG
jgi:hypothetical protein